MRLITPEIQSFTSAGKLLIVFIFFSIFIPSILIAVAS